MNNSLKIISVPYLALPFKVWENFFPKKTSHEKTKTLLGKKNYGEVILNRTNDQIMPRFEKSFINDKCIFQ